MPATGEPDLRGKPATLYIVSTPIGNLEDMSFRAVRTLSEVDLIAAEDTRRTKLLLDHYDIHTPMTSYFSYNESRRIPEILAKLSSGTSIAIVSDAGTPGISDPSSRLVSAAIQKKIPIVPVPGATAFLPALVISGLATDRFVFEGFLPVKKGRATLLRNLKLEERTIILYESPHRLVKTLQNLLDTLGDRRVSVSRELTKKFEEVFRNTLSSAVEYFTENGGRGEFVLVIEGARRGRGTRSLSEGETECPTKVAQDHRV